MNAAEVINDLFKQNQRLIKENESLKAIIEIDGESIVLLKDNVKIQREIIESMKRSLDNLSVSAGNNRPATKSIKGPGNIIRLIPNFNTDIAHQKTYQ